MVKIMVIIDRFEEDFAVCEDGDSRIEIRRSLLPAEAREGDVLVREGGAWLIDTGATVQRRADIAEKLRKLGR
jgi:hypothetical protein